MSETIFCLENPRYAGNITPRNIIPIHHFPCPETLHAISQSQAQVVYYCQGNHVKQLKVTQKPKQKERTPIRSQILNSRKPVGLATPTWS